MNKKIIALFAVLFLVGSASVFAVGIGVQGGYVIGEKGNGALTFKLNSPYLFAVEVGPFGSNGVSVGVTGDAWIRNPKLVGPFGYFYGFGLAVNAAVAGNAAQFGVGPRLVGGLNLFLVKHFELYAQIAWQPTIMIGGNPTINPIIACFPVNIGFRFWF